MRNRLRILLLVVLLLALAGIGDLSASKPPGGLICGTPDDPIPCSTYDTSQCTYTYDHASNCCKAGGFPCLNRCC
jgi:hypothetical protein